jgi:hypothetical protein
MAATIRPSTAKTTTKMRGFLGAVETDFFLPLLVGLVKCRLLLNCVVWDKEKHRRAIQFAGEAYELNPFHCLHCSR